MMNTSIIISTKNEERHLGACLESIDSQDYPKESLEVIVVDNNSSDATKEIAKNFRAKVFNFGPERSAQRNFGVRQAQGKYVLYLDADMRLSPSVISECVKKIEEDNCVALYIPERILGKGFWVKVRDFERSFYDATCIDAVRFIRRDVFLKAGGFDENFNEGEDWDLNRRIAALGKIGIIGARLYHDESEFCLKSYLAKKSRYARNLDRYIAKWGKEDPLIKKQVGFFYRFFGVFMEEGRFWRLLRHPFLTLGMYFLRGTVGILYLGAKK